MDLICSPKFRSRAGKLMEKYHVPGLSIAIVQGDEIASDAFGLARVSSSQPCTPDSLFDIASSSKSLTAAAIGLLVEDDKYPNLKYETPVSELLPEDFVLLDDTYTRDVTVEDMLSHRTGLAAHDTSYLGVTAENPDNCRSVTRNLRNLQICAPIRSKYVYNNMMYTAATHLLETTTKTQFCEFLDKYFFKPLGMTSTSLQPAQARSRGFGDRIAYGYAWDEKGSRYSEFEPTDCPEAQGAGSIITSANDYIKWVKALMYREGPITESVFEGLTKTRTFSNPTSKELDALTSPSSYATGLGIVYYRGHAIIAHTGGVPGYSSRHFFVPSLKFGGVILANALEAINVINILAKDLIDDVLKLPEDERLDRDKITAADPEDEETEDDGWQKVYPDAKESQPQQMPLNAYTGLYWNPGYRGFKVEVKDSKLYIDATDRSFPLEMTLTHVSDQTSFVAEVRYGKGMGGLVVEQVKVQFRFENDEVIKMGLDLEPNIHELIWFDRVE